MKVFNIGTSEVSIIEEALSHKEDLYRKLLQDNMSDGARRDIEYELAHVRTTHTLMKDMRLQELCEVCLSYFWDRLKEEGIDNPDVEYVADMIGIDEEELKMLFKEAGYEED